MDNILRLEALMETIETTLPEEVERFIVLAVPGGQVTRCHGSDDLVKQGPEILGTMVKSICEQFGIELWEAMRRVQNAAYSRVSELPGCEKATMIARLNGGPLDGQAVEICEPLAVIRVPFFSRWRQDAPVGELKNKNYAEYSRAPDSKFVFGTEIVYHYGKWGIQ